MGRNPLNLFTTNSFTFEAEPHTDDSVTVNYIGVDNRTYAQFYPTEPQTVKKYVTRLLDKTNPNLTHLQRIFLTTREETETPYLHFEYRTKLHPETVEILSTAIGNVFQENYSKNPFSTEEDTIKSLRIRVHGENKDDQYEITGTINTPDREQYIREYSEVISKLVNNSNTGSGTGDVPINMFAEQLYTGNGTLLVDYLHEQIHDQFPVTELSPQTEIQSLQAESEKTMYITYNNILSYPLR